MLICLYARITAYVYAHVQETFRAIVAEHEE